MNSRGALIDLSGAQEKKGVLLMKPNLGEFASHTYNDNLILEKSIHGVGNSDTNHSLVQNGRCDDEFMILKLIHMNKK